MGAFMRLNRIVAFPAVLAFIALLAPVMVMQSSAQTPERRFAFVIGNTEYRAGQLPTAGNDAGLLAETLRGAGFDVTGARDLDQDTLRRSIRDFLGKVSAAGPEAVTFVYLAGYGLQFEGRQLFCPNRRDNQPRRGHSDRGLSNIRSDETACRSAGDGEHRRGGCRAAASIRAGRAPAGERACFG
jgi:Caspase domain